MSWLKIAAAVVGAAVAYVVVAGSVVARAHVATVRATYRQSAEELYTALTERLPQKEWRSDLKSVANGSPRDGKPTFREDAGFGEIEYIVDEAVAPHRYVVRILDDSLAFGGRWVHELEPVPEGTRVTISEEGEVKSLLFRALSPFFSKTATLERFLTDLGRRYGETTVPEVVRAK